MKPCALLIIYFIELLKAPHGEDIVPRDVEIHQQVLHYFLRPVLLRAPKLPMVHRPFLLEARKGPQTHAQRHEDPEVHRQLWAEA